MWKRKKYKKKEVNRGIGERFQVFKDQRLDVKGYKSNIRDNGPEVKGGGPGVKN